MSNDTDYKLIFGHPKRHYLEQVMNHLIEKKQRYEQKKSEKISLQQHLQDLGLNSPADFVSWGFSFGKITKAGTFQTVEATTWANENSSNVHITGEDGELASLLKVFTELDISGSYRDEYSAGSIQGYEKIQEQSREEVDAEEAEWGSDDYSEATKTLLNKTYHGPFGLKEARQLIEEGADLNASMNGTCFGGMLADPGWELYKAIPEFLEKGMEMQTIGYLHPDLARALAKKYVDFELGGLFHLDTNTAKILVEEVSKRQPPKGEVFLLNLALSEISEELAKVLAQFPGILVLGLQELDLKAAQALVAKANEQSCDGLALNLRSLKEVSLDVAKVLACYPGDLDLGLTDLDASLAAALASHKGLLTFSELGCYSGSGVFELDERTAAELGKHHGPLRIFFLRYLSAKSASGLAKNTHGLYFQDLGTWNRQKEEPNEFKYEEGNIYRCKLDDQTLSELMKCPGEVLLGIDRLTPEQAKICASHPGTLWLPYLRRLQPKAACCLAKKAGNLNLSGLEELSDEICKYFSDFPFTLSLENLEKVSPEGLQSLTRLHNAPEPTGIYAPALFGNEEEGIATTSQQPDEERKRLAALLKTQMSSINEIPPIEDFGGAPAASPSPKADQPSSSLILAKEPKIDEIRRPNSPASLNGFDVDKLREDLRREIKAEVLREIQTSPKTEPPEDRFSKPSAREVGPPSNKVNVAQKDPDLSTRGFKFTWLIFPISLLVGWLLLRLLPPTPPPQAELTPTTNTVTQTNQVILTPDPTQAATSTSAIVEPRPAETTESRPRVHVVTQGDTYWGLVRKYFPDSTNFNHQIERLRDANSNLDEKSLSIGTEVVIPPEEIQDERSSPETPEARGTKAAERLAEGETEESAPDASGDAEANRSKSPPSKMMQRSRQ